MIHSLQWEAVRPRGRFTTGNTPFNTNKLATVASLLAHQAHGLPLANHALFLRCLPVCVNMCLLK